LSIKYDICWQYFNDFPDNQLTKFGEFIGLSSIVITTLNFAGQRIVGSNRGTGCRPWIAVHGKLSTMGQSTRPTMAADQRP